MKLNKRQIKIYEWILSKSGYLKKGEEFVVNQFYKYQIDKPFDYSKGDVLIAFKQAKIDYKARKLAQAIGVINKDKITPIKEIHRGSNIRTIESIKQSILKSNRNSYDKNNVLFLPDLHAPFIKLGVLEFCLEQQDKYKCGTVIFAGDIVDGHAWSYHEHDVDGMSVGAELSAAKIQLEEWFKAFPNAISLMGNHDLLIQRKAKTIGLSKHFIKGFGDVLNAPKTWEFKLEHIFHNVLYKHGSVGDAFTVAKKSRISTAQGHFHSKTFVQWSVSEKDAIFGMQVGWGADRDAYAFDYGKSFSDKPIISLGLILDKGTTPIVKLMSL